MYDVGEEILHMEGLVDWQFEIETKTAKSTPWKPNSQNQPKPLKNAADDPASFWGKGSIFRAELFVFREGRGQILHLAWRKLWELLLFCKCLVVARQHVWCELSRDGLVVSKELPTSSSKKGWQCKQKLYKPPTSMLYGKYTLKN